MKFEKLKNNERVVCSAVFLVCLGGFLLLYAFSRGWLSAGMLFGVCGFRQKTGLPCPGCFVTTSAVEFVQGNIAEAFYIQPAGAMLCALVLIVGVFSLLSSLFGVDFGLVRLLKKPKAIKYIIIFLVIMFLAGWAVTLARAIMQNQGAV